ncbi:MAG: ABC transporter permease [Bacillota bacterium]|nr:MAG: ABC transporter permease [Bacillota bacterium]
MLIGGAIVLFYAFLAVFAPALAPFDPEELGVGPPLQLPDSTYRFGTTYLGYDLFSRTVYGTRIALTVVFLASTMALLAGVPLGLFSGYLGGWFDRVAVLIMDSVYSFPDLILAVVVAAVLGGGVVNAAIAVSVIYVPQYFRVTRNHTLSVREETFVEAARALGASKLDTIRRYIFPNVSQSIPVILTLNSADAILTLAGLSFLGFGITPPKPFWGLDISQAWRYLTLTKEYPQVWWWTAIPGFAIVVLIIGFTLLGEGLNDILNPQLRDSKR